MLLTVSKVNGVLSGVIGDAKYAVPYTDEIFKSLTDLENQFDNAQSVSNAKAIIANAQTILEGASIKKALADFGDSLKYDEAAQKYYLYSNGITSSIPLPKVLAEKINEAVEKQLPTLPLIKAWTWFLKNPKFSSKKANMFAKYITTTYVDSEVRAKLIEQGYSYEKAHEMATYQDVAITKNGLLSTYKYAQIKYKMYNQEGEQVDRYSVVYDTESGKATVELPAEAEDYYLIPPVMGESHDAFFAGETLGHRIVVGQSHVLPEWSMVDCTDGVACRPGLHLGGRTYIQGYGGRGSLLLNCFVNPMFIGAFTDTGDGAIRVKEYFVHSAQFAPNKSMYHESGYLDRSNAEWAKMRDEAIASSNAIIAKETGKQTELYAL
jgi:hypothetical protein